MIEKKSICFLFFISLIFSNNLHACYEAFEEYVKESKRTPLISGKDREEILRNRQAAITVCTTSIKGIFDFVYEHIFLVFEIKHYTNNPSHSPSRTYKKHQ